MRPIFSISPVVLSLALIFFSSPLAAGAQGRIGGASRFVFLDEEFAFMGPSQSTCGEEIPGAAEGTPPTVDLGPAESLSSGFLHFLPALSFHDATAETTVSIQNVGTEDGIPIVLVTDGIQAIQVECGGILAPGSSFTLGPETLSEDARGAIVISYSADLDIPDASNAISLCALFQQFLENGALMKGSPPPTFDEAGPEMAVTVQRSPLGQDPDRPRVSTFYNGISNRMFEAYQPEDSYRYAVARVTTSETEETEIHLTGVLPFLVAKGVGGFSGFFSSFYQDEVTGATAPGPTGSLPPGSSFSFKSSDFVGEGFRGSWIVDASAPLAVVADLSYPNRVYTSFLGARANDSNHFDEGTEFAVAPILLEEGWETRVALTNQDNNQTLIHTIEVMDSLGNVIAQDMLTIPPHRTDSLTFPPFELGPGRRVGHLKVTVSNDDFTGMVEQRKIDENGDVTEAISFNLFEQDVTHNPDTFTSSKGFLAEEVEGAQTLALPLVGKDDPGSGRVSEILLTNLNPRPGLTAATIYLHDSAGLRDIQCVTLRPLETLLIPVDFPRLGKGAAASLIVHGTETSQKVPGPSLQLFNTFALAAVGIQRTESPPPPPPSSEVSLAPGGNDAGMATLGVYLPIASAGVGDVLYFPTLNAAGATDSVSDTLEIFASEFGNVVAGVVFFGSREIVGIATSPTFSGLEKFVLEEDSIPRKANSAVAFSFAAIDTAGIARFEGLESLADYQEFLDDYSKVEGFVGGPMLDGTLHRNAPSAADPAKRVLASYEPISGRSLGVRDPVFSGYHYLVPVVLTDGGFNTALSVQNGSPLESQVELTFLRTGSPLKEPTVKSLERLEDLEKGIGLGSIVREGDVVSRIEKLNPGISTRVVPAEIVGAGFQGMAVVRSSQPLAIAVDLFSGGTLSTYHALPDELNYSFDPNTAFFTRGSNVAYAPLSYFESEGWETHLHIANLSRIIDAKVRIDTYDSGGHNVSSRTGFIPPGRTGLFSQETDPVDGPDSPSNTRWIQITSEEYWQEGTPQALGPNIVAVVQLVKHNSGGCILESICYNAYADRFLFDFPANDSPFPQHLAFPSAFKGFGPYQLGTEVSLVNLNPNPGQSTLTNVQFVGEGFTSNLSDLVLGGREILLFRTQDIGGIPADVTGSLSFNATNPNSDQEGGPGFAGIAVHRAYGLLPNAPCEAPNETPTPTPTLTAESTPTTTATDTFAGTPTSTPSEDPNTTPTATPTPGGETATATPTSSDASPTPSGTIPEGVDDELLRADINRDRIVNASDVLILLRWWLESY